jgi:hypothetical protein
MTIWSRPYSQPASHQLQLPAPMVMRSVAAGLPLPLKVVYVPQPLLAV